MKRFSLIALHVLYWLVRQQCQLLGVSVSSYYARGKRVVALVDEPAPPA